MSRYFTKFPKPEAPSSNTVQYDGDKMSLLTGGSLLPVPLLYIPTKIRDIKRT